MNHNKQIELKPGMSVCRYGYHWTWTSQFRRIGFCVRDYSWDCHTYNNSLGLCEQCKGNFWFNSTSRGEKMCINSRSMLMMVIVILVVVGVLCCCIGIGIAHMKFRSAKSNNYSNMSENQQPLSNG